MKLEGRLLLVCQPEIAYVRQGKEVLEWTDAPAGMLFKAGVWEIARSVSKEDLFQHLLTAAQLAQHFLP